MSKLYKVKSFSNIAEAGNLAGVVDDASSFSHGQMQQIALKVGASETAFILPSTCADLQVKWFTPNTEVGMCVYATMAALAVLHSQAKLTTKQVSIETKNALLLGEVRQNSIFVKMPDYRLANQTINCDTLLPMLPVAFSQLIGHPGIIEIFEDRELIIEVKTFDDLKQLQPEMDVYKKICHLLDVTGISIFTKDALDPKNQIHTREFAPLYGYLEDPLCGMAAGAIHHYLQSSKSLNVEQGYFCNTSGVIKVEVDHLGQRWVGGEYCICGSEIL